ncbi:corrinoid ABC transporter AT-binding protein, partial [Halorubrum sp. SD612]
PFEEPSEATLAAARDLAADADATLAVGERSGDEGASAVADGPNAEVAAAADRVVPVPADVGDAELLDAVAAATADAE